MKRWRSRFGLVLAAVVCGCESTPPAPPPAVAATATEANVPAADPVQTPVQAFERRQRERALGFAREKRLADAALAWEVLLILRPESSEYRERLAEAQRQIDLSSTDRLSRARQAAQRGDVDAASQQYLAVLALQPGNEQAAEALRMLERDRNKRNYLGKFSRNTLTRRAMADAETKPGNGNAMASRNELEHATLLAGDGEFDDAIALLERRLQVNRGDDAARRLLARIYHGKAVAILDRDRPGAVVALEKSVRLDPANAPAALQLKQLKKREPATP